MSHAKLKMIVVRCKIGNEWVVVFEQVTCHATGRTFCKDCCKYYMTFPEFESNPAVPKEGSGLRFNFFCSPASLCSCDSGPIIL